MSKVFRALQATYFQGEEVYNYGGLVPQFLGAGQPTPTPTPSITPSPTPTPTSSPVVVSPTPTSTPTITPTNTASPTMTPSATPTKTPTMTPSPSPVVYDEYFGSGSTISNACAAAETLQLYSVLPFFSVGQFLYTDPTLTTPLYGMYLSAGDVVYEYDVFMGLQNAVACPAPSPTPSPTPSITPSITPTITPSNTPTITPTPSSTPVTFTAEYNAILARAATLGYAAPSYAQKVLQNQLIVDLKAAGYWSKLGNMYIFKVDLTGGGSSAFTLLNWISPSLTTCSLVIHAGGVVPPVHTPQGWKFTNENYMRIGTNVGGGTNPITTTSIRNSEGTYVADFVANSSSGTNFMWSTDNNSWNRAFYNNVNNHQIFRGVNLTDSYDFTGLGFKSATIDGVITSDTNIYFQNGGIQTLKTKTGGDVGVAGGQLFLNSNGGLSTQSFSWTSGFWWSGAGLSAADIPGFQTIITNYMNA